MSDAKIQHRDCKRWAFGHCDCEVIQLRAEVERLKIELADVTEQRDDYQTIIVPPLNKDNAALTARVEELAATNALLVASLRSTDVDVAAAQKKWLEERVEALETKCALLAASLRQAEERGEKVEAERDELAKKLEAYRNRPATLQKAHEVINRLTEKLHQERGTLRYYTE